MGLPGRGEAPRPFDRGPFAQFVSKRSNLPQNIWDDGATLGTLAFAASGTGELKFSGSATGTCALAASATGELVFTGACSGSFIVAQSSFGELQFTGPGACSVGFSGTANGSEAFQGTCSGGLIVAQSSSGELKFLGSGTCELTFTSTDTGEETFLGTESGSLSFSASGTGEIQFRGACAAALALACAGTVQETFEASGACSFALACSGVGFAGVGYFGTATGQFQLSASANAELAFVGSGQVLGICNLLHFTGPGQGSFLFACQGNDRHLSGEAEDLYLGFQCVANGSQSADWVTPQIQRWLDSTNPSPAQIDTIYRRVRAGRGLPHWFPN